MAKDSVGDANLPLGTIPFFVARFRGNKARFFRVYSDEDSLLFLSAGPFFPMIDAETPRGTDPRHWALRSVKRVAFGLAVGGVVAATALVARSGAGHGVGNPEARGSAFLGVIGVLGLIAVGFMAAVPVITWRIAMRVAEIDDLSLRDLRSRAATDGESFTATPASVTDTTFAPLDPSRSIRPGDEVGARLKFRHATTGKWTIETTTTRDTSDAIRAFRRACGSDEVTVAKDLERQLVGKPTAAEELAAAEAARPKPRIGTSSVNGFGTGICQGRGTVKWGDSTEDYDAVAAIIAMYIPIIPYRAIHTWDWGLEDATTYRSHPIRWSWGLYASALARTVFSYGVFFGLIALLCSLLGPTDSMSRPTRQLLAACGTTAVVLGLAVRWGLGRLDRRNREIRKVLGRHRLGSSDPATWRAKDLHLVRHPAELYGTSSHAEAVPKLLASGRYEAAMFAARLAVATEGRRDGQKLTDDVLNHPEIRAALEGIRRNYPGRGEVPSRDRGWGADLFEVPSDE